MVTQSLEDLSKQEILKKTMTLAYTWTAVKMVQGRTKSGIIIFSD
ncbi:hypothetical protein [Methanobrevibacter boviskoreani]|nr:hypothetical protein [Methanobrevibacter boviskoreani]MDD6256351.1 hypothetical protein [Methanobrevibacter boviskoreani]